ncbi:glycoside hydrolase family 1 protein [[Clostridium] innocuum]|nr:glycoside hydrolase family 1 protein [[Clostridium] innocuum]
MIQFPKGFYFGSATSATQSEGAASIDGKGKNIWDYWNELEPDKFHDRIGPQDASEFYKHYRTDIRLLKETGHNSCRISISWSRMFPNGDTVVNPIAVDHYHKVIDAFHAEGIEVMINLFHFDMPLALQEQGGWESDHVVDAYVHYARTCFKLYGNKVKRWFTFNEPIVHVECGYLNGFHYPCRHDMKAAVQVAYHTALASAKAVQAFHECCDGKIGIILNLTPNYPRSESKEDQRASRIAELFSSRCFLDPAVLGVYPKELVELLREHELLPEYTKEELTVIKENTVDFLGVNYYQPIRVKAKEAPVDPEAMITPETFYDLYEMPNRRINPYRGWEIYPKGMYDIATNIRTKYHNIEWMITENGMGVEHEERFIKDGRIADDYRIAFYKEHLTWLYKGIQEGSNCIGYHVWTGIDCWSWLNAYKNRYGLISLDLKTQKRTIKKSGYWFRELAERGGFE